MNKAERANLANGARMPRIVIPMPYPQGSGLAWTYIERVAGDLTKLVCENSGSLIAYPKIDEAEETRSIVRRKFYATTLSEVVTNARWLAANHVSHLYFAEHVAYDWRFAIYRFFADVRISVHYHHAGGRSTPHTAIGRVARVIRRWIPLLLADDVICVSEFVRQRVINISHVPEGRCITILNAVLPEGFMSPNERHLLRKQKRQYLDIPDGDVAVICGARADLEKGIDFLFDAFDSVCADRLNAGTPLPWLLYAGDGPHFEILKAKREALTHRDRIKMLGRVSPMRELLPVADIGVLPSVCDEAFGLFAIECMQASLPVIVTDRGGLTECVTDGSDGFIVPARDTRALANRLAMLVENIDLRMEMGKRGEERVRVRNSYDTMIRRLFSTLMHRGGVPAKD